MINFVSVLKRDLSIDVSNIEGGGAAGGLGAGCVAFLNASLIGGIELVMQLSSLEDHIDSCDLIITGEGKIDDQSLQGKVISGVAAVAKKYDKKVIAICGSLMIGLSQLKSSGIDAAFSILYQLMSLQEAIENAEPLLEGISFNLGTVFQFNLLRF